MNPENKQPHESPRNSNDTQAQEPVSNNPPSESINGSTTPTIIGSIMPDNQENAGLDNNEQVPLMNPPIVQQSPQKSSKGYRILMAILWGIIVLMLVAVLAIKDEGARAFIAFLFGIFGVLPLLIVILIVWIVHRLQQKRISQNQIEPTPISMDNPQPSDILLQDTKIKFITKTAIIYTAIVVLFFIATFIGLRLDSSISSLFTNTITPVIVFGVLNITGVIGALYSIILLWNRNKKRMIVLLLMFTTLLWIMVPLLIVGDSRSKDFANTKYENEKSSFYSLPYDAVITTGSEYIVNFEYGIQLGGDLSENSVNIRMIRKNDVATGKEWYKISDIEVFMAKASQEDAITKDTTKCKKYDMAKTQSYDCRYLYSTPNGVEVAYTKKLSGYLYFIVIGDTYVTLEDVYYSGSSNPPFFNDTQDPDIKQFIDSLKTIEPNQLDAAYEEYNNLAN